MSQFAAIVSLSVLLAATATEAESPNPRANQVRTATPSTGRIDDILEKWRAAFDGVHRSQTSFDRYEYDSVFLIEKRGQGELHYQAPDRISWTFKPVDMSRPTDPRRDKSSGKQYLVKSIERETWYLDRHEMLAIHHEERTYDRLEMPRQMRDVCISSPDSFVEFSPETVHPQSDGLLHPFLPRFTFMYKLRSAFQMMSGLVCGQQLGVIQGHFRWTIDRDTNDGICLVGRPLSEEASRCFHQVDVLLDPETYRPTAVQFIDPSDLKSTVYVIRDVTVDGSLNPVQPPSLRGYKLLSVSTGASAGL